MTEPTADAGLPVLGVLGLGLIGGSVAQRWADLGGPVVGWSRSAGTRSAAAQHGGLSVVEAVEAVVERADVVVLATPLSVLADTLDQVAAALDRNPLPPVITDVGSVKGAITAHARATLPDPSAFVPGHPMAGTERAGWSAADPNLFEGSRWALALDEPVGLDHWQAVAALAVVLGAEVVPVLVAEHDQAVAVTSHLPHVLAALLAQSLDDAPAVARSLAGPSFRSATRVVQGDGRLLGAELAAANAAVLGATSARFASRLTEVVDALARLAGGGDEAASDALRDLFAHADVAEALAPTTAPGTVALDRGALVDLGRAGGVVVGFDADGQVQTRTPVARTGR